MMNELEPTKIHHPFKGVVKPFAGKKQQFVSAGVGLVHGYQTVNSSGSGLTTVVVQPARVDASEAQSKTTASSMFLSNSPTPFTRYWDLG